MKRVVISFIISVLLIGTSAMFTEVRATDNVISNQTATEITEMKEKTKKELSDYEELYGSKSYGMTAYALNKIRLYSIPFCFLGIAIGAIYQYVIGIRRLDIRDRGFVLIIAFVTIFVIAQVLPLIFAIVVKGWRG